MSRIVRSFAHSHPGQTGRGASVSGSLTCCALLPSRTGQPVPPTLLTFTLSSVSGATGRCANARQASGQCAGLVRSTPPMSEPFVEHRSLRCPVCGSAYCPLCNVPCGCTQAPTSPIAVSPQPGGTGTAGRAEGAASVSDACPVCGRLDCPATSRLASALDSVRAIHDSLLEIHKLEASIARIRRLSDSLDAHIAKASRP